MCATPLLTAAAPEACPRTNATGADVVDRYRSGLWIFQSCAHVKTLPPDDWANADRLPTQSLAPLRQAETATLLGTRCETVTARHVLMANKTRSSGRT